MKHHHHSAASEKSHVALTSVVAAVGLTGTKIVVGVMTGSLGILSEAAHSALDLVAAVITLFAVKASGRPADDKHTYGYGKVESLSALIETLLLLVTCVWIIYEAVRRLFFHEVHVEVTVWSFVVIIGSIVVDISRSRALMRVAKKYRSLALEADALHFSTDVWSSTVVLFGLFLVLLSERLQIPWLVTADSLAALVVAGIVIWISFKLGKRTIDDLLDSVPTALMEEIVLTSRVPGVAEVKRTRVRRSGHEFFVDLTVAVHCDVSFAAAHKIAHESEKAVREKFPQADVVVHVDPAGESHENTAGRIRETAARHELFAHAIAVSSAGGQGAIEMHLEVDPALSVADAHRKVSAFEKDLHETLPSFPLITTHIEPVGTPNVHQRRPDPGDEARIRNLVGRLAEENREHVQFHDLTTRREEGKLAVIFHCACDGTISVAEAHDLTEKFEARLREGMPELGRVVIHIEPRENSHH